MHLFLKLRHIHPRPLLPALDTQLGELHSLSTLQQAVLPRLVFDHMAKEHFPLHLEGVVEGLVIRHARPALGVLDGRVYIRVPGWSRRLALVLRNAIAETGYGAALGAVDLDRQEVVATHADSPGRVEVDHDAVLELEGSVRRVVGRALVRFALLIDTLLDVGRARASQRVNVAEQVLDHVLPVAQHVADDAAVVFLAVVPAGTLRNHGALAVEDPVAKLAADRQDLAEEAAVDQSAELDQAGQPELVLHDAVLDAGVDGRLVQIVRLLRRHGRGLLAVDVLALGDGLLDGVGATAGGLGVEVDGVVGIVEARVQVGRGPRDAVGLAEVAQLERVSADEDGVRHDDLAVGELDAALVADGAD